MKNKTFLQMSLEEMGITSYEEYKEKITKWEDFDFRVFHNGQEKIDALRDLVASYYHSYQYNQLSGQYISIDPEANCDKNIENYMCLFPKRTLIETSTLLSYFDSTQHDCDAFDLPPNDFFKQYFKFEKLVRNNIAYLYPVKTNEEQTLFTSSVFSSNSLITLKNIARVSQEGNINRIIQNPNVFYMAFPWLYNAKIDDFIDICNNNPAEFDNIAINVEKIALASNGTGDLQSIVLSELKEALTNIQISFEKKKSALKSKGITAVVGLALTCIPYVISDYFKNFDPSVLQTILGGASLIESNHILNEFFSLKKELNDNPYWVIWKWKQKTSKE